MSELESARGVIIRSRVRVRGIRNRVTVRVSHRSQNQCSSQESEVSELESSEESKSVLELELDSGVRIRFRVRVIQRSQNQFLSQSDESELESVRSQNQSSS